MFILRIILSILAIPVLLVLYILKGFFYLFTMIGAKILQAVGSLMLLAGIVFFAIGSGDSGSSSGSMSNYIGMIAGGIGVIFLPYISAFLSGLFGSFADGIREQIFH